MLHHIPWLVLRLLTRLDPTRERAHETHMQSHVKDALFASVRKRLGKYVSDPGQPALLAAWLSPQYHAKVSNIVDEWVQFNEITEGVIKWCKFMSSTSGVLATARASQPVPIGVP